MKIIDLSRVHQISFGEIKNFCKVIFTFFYENVQFLKIKFCNTLINYSYIFTSFLRILLADEFYEFVLLESTFEINIFRIILAKKLATCTSQMEISYHKAKDYMYFTNANSTLKSYVHYTVKSRTFIIFRKRNLVKLKSVPQQ